MSGAVVACISCTNKTLLSRCATVFSLSNIIIEEHDHRGEEKRVIRIHVAEAHTMIYVMMLQSEQDSRGTPGAVWPKFRAPFCELGGKQAQWAQREQGRAVHETVHSYIYSKEVTFSNLGHQLSSYEVQCPLCGVFKRTLTSLLHRSKCIWL